MLFRSSFINNTVYHYDCIPRDCIPLSLYIKRLYTTMIYLCTVLLCIIVWGSAINSTLHNLITRQKRAIRVVSNLSYGTHTGPLFESLRFLKLIDIYQSQVIIYMHKVRYQIFSIHCSSYFKFCRFRTSILDTACLLIPKNVFSYYDTTQSQYNSNKSLE